MDIASHTLWGRLLFGYRGRPWTATFFGACPDLLSFGLWFVIRLVNGTFVMGRPPLEIIPDWVFLAYDITHSLVVSFTAVGLVSVWRKDLAFAMLAWPFHICLDFPFHTKAYFPAKIFWPLTDFVVDGIAWSTPPVWLSNLVGIVILFYWRRHQVALSRHKACLNDPK